MTDKTRADVIRQQMSKELKNSSLPKKEIARILNDIDELEKVWESAKEWRPLWLVLWEVAPWNAKTISAVDIQKKLEKIGNNRLHEIAARIEA